MRLILVRHAESEANVSNDLIENPKLTKLGEEQAKRLAEYLRDIKIDLIYSSDLERAKSTTKLISKYLKCEVKYDKILREISLGSFFGKRVEELRDFVKKNAPNRFLDRLPGGECFQDVFIRARNFLEILKKENHKTIAVVSHGGFIRSFICVLFNLPYEEQRFLSIKNCSISTFDFDDNFNVKDFHINDINHFVRESPYYKG